jgi:triphosphoribosyl-dephospho-CoA synthase
MAYGKVPDTGYDPLRHDVGRHAFLACVLEATAPKPGNVHRGADFADVTYLDFVVSARELAVAADIASRGATVGAAVLAAVSQTRAVVGTNTNLGLALLIVPLARVERNVPLADGLPKVLAGLGEADARDVYQAISMANPGALGQVDEADVHGPPPQDLLMAMRLAADRDSIARQYVNGFADVLTRVVPWLAEGLGRGWSLCDTIVRVHVRLMSELPDTLIARKHGTEVARRAADHAAEVLAAGQPGDEAYAQALADLDFWLRSDGHRRNPGTTADLVAAGLFAALREGIIEMPVDFYGRQRAPGERPA